MYTAVHYFVLSFEDLLYVLSEIDADLQLQHPVVLGHAFKNPVAQLVDVPDACILGFTILSQHLMQFLRPLVDLADESSDKFGHPKIPEHLLPLGNRIASKYLNLVIVAVVDETDKTAHEIADIVE